MNQTIIKTDFQFPNQTSVYKGKVRDVYKIGEEILVMIATDRISAFDTVLPVGIPYKGQVLNQIATNFLDLTSDIIDNWKSYSPDPMVTIGEYCEPFKVEMVIRGYLTGHAWREYRDGRRTLCGEKMPDGLKEHDQFPEPLVTPTTKADKGHDEDISKEEIIETNLVSKEDYLYLEDITKKLFQRGTEYAREKGLILVDTKYEFGKTKSGKIVLIDEIHTPDSSRYWVANEYENRFKNNQPQKMLDKENIRSWLIERGFKGEGTPPKLADDIRVLLAEKYIELYKTLLGKEFVPSVGDVSSRIKSNLTKNGIID